MSNKEGLLSENWDFIEEAAPFSTESLEFQDIDELDISEGESASPKWKPAILQDKPVSVKISVPVEFKLTKSGSFKIKK